MASELIQIKKFKKASIQEINATYFNNYPIVYILYTNAKKETAYIGQTVHLQRRMQKHLSDAMLQEKNSIQLYLLAMRSLINLRLTI